MVDGEWHDHCVVGVEVSNGGFAASECVMLDDFNRCFLLNWIPERNTTCGFSYSHNVGRVSPTT